MHLLQANNLEGYVNKDTPCPSKTTSSSDVAQPNLAYKFWCRQDNHVSHARIISLKERLSSITKGMSSVHDYLRNICSIVDELALIGHPVDDIDLVIAALNGLGPTFREFSASIRTRDSPL
uniref:Retrovirus-related Pol polyprotein from transposon TNT 1-94 n=1 Tax=Cajanus cajan TaxID=3821 RepID=A0A151RTE8_CAJCA|nr:hypothetical protein KK1_032629 [Cajanus cajan]